MQNIQKMQISGRKSSQYTQSTKDTINKSKSSTNNKKKSNYSKNKYLKLVAKTNKKLNIKRKYFLEELGDTLHTKNLTSYKIKNQYSKKLIAEENNLSKYIQDKENYSSIKRKLVFNDNLENNNDFNSYRFNDDFNINKFDKDKSNYEVIYDYKKNLKDSIEEANLKYSNKAFDNRKITNDFLHFHKLNGEFSKKSDLIINSGFNSEYNSNSKNFIKEKRESIFSDEILYPKFINNCINKEFSELRIRQAQLYKELVKIQENSDVYVEKNKFFNNNSNENCLKINLENKTNFPSCYSVSSISIQESSDTQSINLSLSKNNSYNQNIKNNNSNENIKVKKKKQKEVKYIWKNDNKGYIYLNDRSFVKYPNKNKFDIISSLYAPFK